MLGNEILENSLLYEDDPLYRSESLKQADYGHGQGRKYKMHSSNNQYLLGGIKKLTDKHVTQRANTVRLVNASTGEEVAAGDDVDALSGPDAVNNAVARVKDLRLRAGRLPDAER